MNARIWRVVCGALLFAAITLVSGLGLTPAAAPLTVKYAANGEQLFVFLTESRPLLVRVHARIDGKPVVKAWEEFMKELFAYLDVNGDGVLDKEEAERVPSPLTIRTAGIPIGARGASMAAPTLANLDLDRDGKVSFAELKMYYRRNGLAPFQFQLDPPPPSINAALFYGKGIEPPVEAVSAALFTLLDSDGDGKLTHQELARAPAVLQRLDEDEDEILTSRELAPDYKPRNDLFSQVAMMATGPKSSPAHLRAIVPIEYQGHASADLVRALQHRYGPKMAKPEAKKLTRKDLGLDEATFRRLDTNGDGMLDARELGGFVHLTPDLELTAHVGDEDTRVEPAAVSASSAVAGKVKRQSGLTLVDLGLTRVVVRGGPAEASGFGSLSGLVRTQMMAAFRGADKDGSGYLNSKEAKADRVYRDLYKAMDRDGDGKLYEKEVAAYLDQYQTIQEKAQACCVSLVFADQGAGLFTLLDTNRDGRLGVREIRAAAGLLKQLDRERKGYLVKSDLPRSYELTLRPGPAGADPLDGAAALYRGYDSSKTEVQAKGGPAWFRRMDRNRDGDISRKEWIFSEELFRKIDTDGDGLISLEEAERHDALMRKQQE